MSSTLPTKPHRKALIGSPSNFWLHSSQAGFDLTHPSGPSTPTEGPTITIQTTNTPITIAPSNSALVIIDMQNFFLSPAFGRRRGAGHSACDQLIQHAIPAARKAGIRIIWLNWGLTDEDVRNMPPAVKRAFGFFAVPADIQFKAGGEAFGDHPESVTLNSHGNTTERSSAYKGLGANCGILKLDGKEVDAGKLLMRDQWNAALYAPLEPIYQEGIQLPHNPDVWIHKDRMSGLWGAKTACEEFLEKEGIKTLLFAGVNTDQCVGGTLTDAFSKGYDCILLSDGCGTTSPEYAQKCYEYNGAGTYGFVTSCEGFAKGVEAWSGFERRILSQ
ncbi:Isochorismatase hydrolase [Ophiobolus disseminans]|uniref:Isochorismatase hydrolase n=1 Tax=Ophiobolus disseminans TaxID=1469910 RepID=A0A6A6ZGU1_9PLEO|nr:Isochorismatase hydrolase [Ophiobolus disseminans]